jgi:hypothetical protein
VSEVISLEPENFDLPTAEGQDDTVTITPPCAHTGPAPVKVRLISHALREGMVINKLFIDTHIYNPSVLRKKSSFYGHCLVVIVVVLKLESSPFFRHFSKVTNMKLGILAYHDMIWDVILKGTFLEICLFLNSEFLRDEHNTRHADLLLFNSD